ncbi:hypothetical protein TVAG_422750 [Trichomonas vaginalis G3]|uniref:Uncharacterized protein n=1 Tax=Trichomonas vaginalis (strain ATCC PRA-98 / G3) TaxID=412133 RepID=A2FKG1_TRIV3|nr:hypothetical protein TVAG_422750 [Trichomonas vaginalis G3]|eukprot:XP_001307532.1 hypothetical protein [Trichomonas vaginalis G3]
MSYNYNLSIRCQGLKTLHAIIFKNNYKEITSKFYTLRNTFGKKFYLPSSDCIPDDSEYTVYGYKGVRIYVISDVPCNITFYRALNILMENHFEVYSKGRPEYKHYPDSDPEYSVYNVTFAYFDVVANFTQGQLAGVKSIQISDPSYQLPPDAVVYAPFSNITDLDEPPNREIYRVSKGAFSTALYMRLLKEIYADYKYIIKNMNICI